MGVRVGGEDSSDNFNGSLSFVCNEGLLLLTVGRLTRFVLACLLELSSDGWSGVVGNSVEQQGRQTLLQKN